MDPRSILEHHDAGTHWPDHHRATDVAAAYRDALAVRSLRIVRGETPVGYKVGFTNRTIWTRYGVFAPIWGTVWDTTLVRCDGEGLVDLDATCQPRIEPEVAFGIRATPRHDASLDDLFACVSWIAPSFEVVQSHCPDWTFSAADTVADGALHARLLIGAALPVATLARTGTALDERLAALKVRLSCDGTTIDEGSGANVLDGPLHALHHFVRELQRCADAPALKPGDVVTTGTWTDAWPIAPGQTWRSRFDGVFAPLAVTLR